MTLGKHLAEKHAAASSFGVYAERKMFPEDEEGQRRGGYLTRYL